MNYYVTGSTVPVGVVIPSVSLNVQSIPIAASSRKLRFGWTVTTHSMVYPEQDRTGQLVREHGAGDVFLVRESAGNEHTLVDASNAERRLGESEFWPWGPWKRVAG